MVDELGAADSLRQLRARLIEVNESLGKFRALLHEKECLGQAIHVLEQIGRDNPPVPIWQAARDLLERKGKPMTAKQITDALLSTGLKIEGKTPMESVRVALIRKAEVIERLSDGRFQSKEIK